jgi:hypothetical protein
MVIKVMIEPTKPSMVFFTYFVMTIKTHYLFKNLKNHSFVLYIFFMLGF